MKMEQVADEEMVKNAVGDDYDELAEPPAIELADHPLVPAIRKNLKDIFDPEIPVNIYELGLIYKIDVKDVEDGKADVAITMTLTSPACPVAQDMPGWVQGAAFKVDGVRHVDIDMVWEPAWTPAKMAETAKLQLNMFV